MVHVFGCAVRVSKLMTQSFVIPELSRESHDNVFRFHGGLRTLRFAKRLSGIRIAVKELKLSHHKVKATFFYTYIEGAGCHKLGPCTPQIYYNPEGRDCPKRISNFWKYAMATKIKLLRSNSSCWGLVGNKGIYYVGMI